MTTISDDTGKAHLQGPLLKWLALGLALILALTAALWARYGGAVFAEIAIAALNICM